MVFINRGICACRLRPLYLPVVDTPFQGTGHYVFWKQHPKIESVRGTDGQRKAAIEAMVPHDLVYKRGDRAFQKAILDNYAAERTAVGDDEFVAGLQAIIDDIVSGKQHVRNSRLKIT